MLKIEQYNHLNLTFIKLTVYTTVLLLEYILKQTKQTSRNRLRQRANTAQLDCLNSANNRTLHAHIDKCQQQQWLPNFKDYI